MLIEISVGSVRLNVSLRRWVVVWVRIASVLIICFNAAFVLIDARAFGLALPLFFYLFYALFDLLSEGHHHNLFVSVVVTELLGQLWGAVFHTYWDDDVLGKALAQLNSDFDMVIFILFRGCAVHFAHLSELRNRRIFVLDPVQLLAREFLVYIAFAGFWLLVSEAELPLSILSNLAHDSHRGTFLELLLGRGRSILDEAHILNIAHAELINSNLIDYNW